MKDKELNDNEIEITKRQKKYLLSQLMFLQMIWIGLGKKK